MSTKYELVFVPVPAIGHILSKLEFAKLLLTRSPDLSITIFIIHIPNRKPLDFNRTEPEFSNRLNFIDLEYDPQFTEPIASQFLFSLLNSHKPKIKQTLIQLTQSKLVAGVVLDMFCSSIVEVVKEVGNGGIPSYLYFTSGANFLATLLHLQAIHDYGEKVDVLRLGVDCRLSVNGFVNVVPCGALPSMVFNPETNETFYQIGRWVREMKGIVINTFMEFESYTIESLSEGLDVNVNVPVLYPVGPLLNFKKSLVGDEADERLEIVEWLDMQPALSVVFLCFGSMGKLAETQIVEIAIALDRSGYRFLWSLRMDSQENPEDIIPEEVMKRMNGVGKIIGWAPQADILAHPAVGGFVSHCGWNSILESIWFGVPIAAWAMYAEQHINGFMMVKEQGLAVEINIDHGKDFAKQKIVYADSIEKGIREVMEIDSEVRKKVKELSEKSRKAVAAGGSSYNSLGNFIEDVIKNAT